MAMPAGAVLTPALMNIPRLFVPGHHRGGGLRTTCTARRSITRNQNQGEQAGGWASRSGLSLLPRRSATAPLAIANDLLVDGVAIHEQGSPRPRLPMSLVAVRKTQHARAHEVVYQAGVFRAGKARH